MDLKTKMGIWDDIINMPEATVKDYNLLIKKLLGQRNKGEDIFDLVDENKLTPLLFAYSNNANERLIKVITKGVEKERGLKNSAAARASSSSAHVAPILFAQQELFVKNGQNISAAALRQLQNQIPINENGLEAAKKLNNAFNIDHPKGKNIFAVDYAHRFALIGFAIKTKYFTVAQKMIENGCNPYESQELLNIAKTIEGAVDIVTLLEQKMSVNAGAKAASISSSSSSSSGSAAASIQPKLSTAQEKFINDAQNLCTKALALYQIGTIQYINAVRLNNIFNVDYKAGVDIFDRNYTDRAIVISSAIRTDLSIAQEMLENGFNLSEGETLLGHARDKNAGQIVKLIEQKMGIDARANTASSSSSSSNMPMANIDGNINTSSSSSHEDANSDTLAAEEILMLSLSVPSNSEASPKRKRSDFVDSDEIDSKTQKENSSRFSSSSSSSNSLQNASQLEDKACFVANINPSRSSRNVGSFTAMLSKANPQAQMDSNASDTSSSDGENKSRYSDTAVDSSDSEDKDWQNMVKNQRNNNVPDISKC